ncbi:hypothetical protein H2248_000971 [Termitomyces sp. 'cryptogamus']|nr:hypothetical protein H2248_000971 [Termitomyces sp. 'cryptogamus']
MIAQYKQAKLKVDEAERTKDEFLVEVQNKKLEIEKDIGFTNDSIRAIPAAARTVSSLVAETYTILTATGSAIVFANQGRTRTVPLNLPSTGIPSLSALTSNPNASTVSSPESTSFAVPSFPSASVSPVASTPVSSSSACCTTLSLALTSSVLSTTSSLSLTTSLAQSKTIMTQIRPASELASQKSTAAVALSLTATPTLTTEQTNDPSSGVPVTVLTATGSAIVLASHGLTSTVIVDIAVSAFPTGSG